MRRSRPSRRSSGPPLQQREAPPRHYWRVLLTLDVPHRVYVPVTLDDGDKSSSAIASTVVKDVTTVVVRRALNLASLAPSSVDPLRTRTDSDSRVRCTLDALVPL